jgi:hypothetical protein
LWERVWEREKEIERERERERERETHTHTHTTPNKIKKLSAKYDGLLTISIWSNLYFNILILQILLNLNWYDGVKKSLI